MARACMGCRQQASTKDLVWALALRVVRAIWEEDLDLSGVSYDLSKAFDSLPLELEAGRQVPEGEIFHPNDGLLWRIVQRLGFPGPILKVMRSMYGSFMRRFKLQGFLGEEISAKGLRGAFQGDAFSMVLMNAAAVAWFFLQKKGLGCDRGGGGPPPRPRIIRPGGCSASLFFKKFCAARYNA